MYYFSQSMLHIYLFNVYTMTQRDWKTLHQMWHVSNGNSEKCVCIWKTSLF